jgi:hypothetical protein
METLTFSLNLGTALHDSLTPGSTSARDTVRNRISRALQSKFRRKVPFIMVLEETYQGRLHVHGVIQATRDEMSIVDVALRAAGGPWTAHRGEDRQLVVKPTWGAHGWWEYVIKRLQGVDDARKGDWIGWSLPAKRAAVGLHRQVRHWWTLNRDDLTVRHSMHFYVGDTSLADEFAHFFRLPTSLV